MKLLWVLGERKGKSGYRKRKGKWAKREGESDSERIVVERRR